VARIAGAAAVATALFTAGWEGNSPKVYTDPVGIKTVCVGHAYTGPEGQPLRAGEVYSDDVCSYLLGQDILTAQKAVAARVRVPLSAGETLAYTDFVFNVGAGSFGSSTLLRLLNAGKHGEACRELLKWVYGGGQKLPGLVKRRQAEYTSCLSDLS
jgi:lysozyme